MSHRTDRHEPEPGAVLQAVGLHAGFPGGPDVLDCIGLDVVPGRRLALLGANGSGKTTLLRCLSGAHRPSHGEVRVDGIALTHRRRALDAHRQQVQLVLQDPDDQLFSARVDQDVAFGPTNLGLPAEEIRQRTREALCLLGIDDLVERPVHHLSYGQRKRVAIAGAVAMRPRVLLLDEPTAGLDPVAVREMHTALSALEEHGTTVVLSTHDVDLAWGWADEVAVVHSARVHQGLTAKVLNDSALLSAARLEPPWVVRLADRLGLPLDPAAPPRTAEQLADLVDRR